MSTAALPLVLLGAGGHAKVLAALALACGHKMLGVCDPALAVDSVTSWEELNVLGDDRALEELTPSRVALLMGIGHIVTGNLREKLYSSWRDRGYDFPVMVHPTAWVASRVLLDDGVQVMAGCVIQPGCEIRENSIVNTRSSIDHDCSIGSNVHLAPGVTLCGSVSIEDGVFIGAGATVIQGVRIGKGSLVGAGVTVVRDLPARSTLIGASNRLR